MRRTTMFGLTLALAMGCYREEPQVAAQAQPTPSYQPGRYPPPGYYPPQQPPGYYPQQPPPGYYPPQQPPPRPQPTQPQPQPQPTQQPQPQPQPQPTQQQLPYNPWLTMLGNLLNGGAPPAPAPGPQPAPAPTTPTPPPAPPAPAINPRALDLANAINNYRAQNGLPPIPISKSLSHVADTHVHDLQRSPKVAPTCNGHSWSANGPWTPCCYTADHAQAKCMWQKPAELTPFKGTGFEITIGQPGEQSTGFVLDSQKAITAWQGSSLHNDVLLNRGTWQKMTWRAMGAGIVDSHACAWFSDQADTAP